MVFIHKYGRWFGVVMVNGSAGKIFGDDGIEALYQQPCRGFPSYNSIHMLQGALLRY
jgi:hypothetical protein